MSSYTYIKYLDINHTYFIIGIWIRNLYKQGMQK